MKEKFALDEIANNTSMIRVDFKMKQHEKDHTFRFGLVRLYGTWLSLSFAIIFCFVLFHIETTSFNSTNSDRR